jgi:hypothetical protein
VLGRRWGRERKAVCGPRFRKMVSGPFKIVSHRTFTSLEEIKIMTATETRAKHTHIFKRDRNDRYVEPRWCSARLFAVEHFDGPVFDPCAGTGQILAAAAAIGLDAVGADIAPCIDGVMQSDFFADQTVVANIVSNPPYDRMREFALHALERVESKVALLLPAARLNAAGSWLASTPLRRVWLLSPRPSIPPHSYLLAGHKPSGGRVDFGFWVWQRGYRGYPHLRWLHRDGNNTGDITT